MYLAQTVSKCSLNFWNFWNTHEGSNCQQCLVVSPPKTVPPRKEGLKGNLWAHCPLYPLVTFPHQVSVLSLSLLALNRIKHYFASSNTVKFCFILCPPALPHPVSLCSCLVPPPYSSFTLLFSALRLSLLPHSPSLPSYLFSSSFSFFPFPLASFFYEHCCIGPFLGFFFLLCLLVYFSDRLYVSIYPKLNLNSGLSSLRLPSSGVIKGMCFYKNVISSLYALRKSHTALWGSLLSI